MPRLIGMTLIELLVTMVILGILTVLAVPAFRNFQGRQDLLVDQQGMQSMLYQMQNLALAPLNSGSSLYDVAGYGLVVLPKSAGTATIGGCTVTTNSDVIALVTIAKFASDGSINDFLTGVYTPTSSTTGNCASPVVDPAQYPNTFFSLSNGVTLSSQSNAMLTNNAVATPLPWLIVQPLQAVGEADGALCGLSQPNMQCQTVNRLQLHVVDFSQSTNATVARLLLKDNALHDPTNPNNFLCRSITFSEDATITIQGAVFSGGCL